MLGRLEKNMYLDCIGLAKNLELNLMSTCKGLQVHTCVVIE